MAAAVQHQGFGIISAAAAAWPLGPFSGSPEADSAFSPDRGPICGAVRRGIGALVNLTRRAGNREGSSKAPTRGSVGRRKGKGRPAGPPVADALREPAAGVGTNGAARRCAKNEGWSGSDAVRKPTNDRTGLLLATSIPRHRLCGHIPIAL